MPSRRTFLRASATALLASAVAGIVRAGGDEFFAYLPTVERYPPPTPVPTEEPTEEPTATPEDPPPGPTDDAPIVGPATGTAAQALAWLAPRADASYTDYDLAQILQAYRELGESVGMDWFLAVAQMAHETGNLTSFWSLRPQRNPAGIGVTGQWSSTPPPDTTGWAYNYQRARWEVGLSFATWAGDSAPAHLGRLLAYALRDEDASDAQRALIARALAYRPLPADRRGVAPRWVDLNGRWAVPGTTYGQSIIDLARRMRGEIYTADAPLSGAEDGDWMPPEG
ncbi:MAG TPA: hypothetical protein VNL77_24850 [Roseiflexaceae bacterium]|nr:hypothetical protein [Roseiflexaceae bacterium]